MNVFEKLRRVRELVSSVYPELGVAELAGVVEFLANNWHGNKRKRGVKLSQQQLTVYELLMSNSYNPTTVYRWLLLANSPHEIREQVSANKLSVRDALKARRKQKRLLSTSEEEFIDAVIKCVRMYVSEPGEGYPGRVGP